MSKRENLAYWVLIAMLLGQPLGVTIGNLAYQHFHQPFVAKGKGK